MYQKILVALENSKYDSSIIPHVSKLAAFFHSKVILMHVADGWAARHYDELSLRESEEMKEDRNYLEKIREELEKQGIEVSTYLALGEPAEEILTKAVSEGCDLIAMTSHGHRFLQDLFYGSTIEEVRHATNIPMLIIKGKNI